MSLLSIGISGLNLSQTQLQVTGNNIANADQPSYTRQRVETATLPEQLRGGGYVGNGSIVQDITRMVDDFLVTRLRLDTASFNSLNAYTTNINQIDSLLADEQSGLGPAIDSFFSALEASAQDPTSEPSRQVVLSQAEALTQRIHDLTSQVEQQVASVNNQLTSLTQQVSSLAASLADVNVKIADEMARGGGSQPNQLLDQRDELLRQLSELVSVSTIDNNGAMDVFIGNGLPLVVGGNAAQMGTATSKGGSGNVDITFINQNGATQAITDFVSGGKLGGLIDFRDDVAGEALNSMGRLAMGMADALNQQNSLGVDLDGNLGGNIFKDINDPSVLSQRISIDSGNSNVSGQAVDSMDILITDVAQLTTSDYVLNIIDSDGTGGVDYQLIRTSDNQVTIINGNNAAQSLEVDGFSIDIPVTTQSNLAIGDRFYIKPTRNGGADMAVEMTRVQDLAYASPVVTNAKTGNSGEGSISAGEMLALVDDGDLNFSPAPTPALYSSPGELAGEVLIRFTSATAYTVYQNTDAAAPQPLFSGTIIPGQKNSIFGDNSGDANYIGFQTVVSGIPAAGDEFTIGFNQNGSSDNRNAVAMGALRTKDTLDGGSTSFENAYGSLISKVGSDAAKSQLSRDAAESLLQQSQSSRDSMSGVNLDEEAANLIKFEQAYNAAAQVISVARQLFDTLIATVR